MKEVEQLIMNSLSAFLKEISSDAREHIDNIVIAAAILLDAWIIDYINRLYEGPSLDLRYTTESLNQDSFETLEKERPIKGALKDDLS